MESENKTNTSISGSSDKTIDFRSLVTANPSLSSSPSIAPQSSSPIDQSPLSSLDLSSSHSCIDSSIVSSSSIYHSEAHPPTPHFAAMATVSKSSTGGDGSSNFNLNAYASVTKLETGTFNDWCLRLTTVMGAHRLSKYLLRKFEAPSDVNALDDHETNLMRALAAIHATIDNKNFEVV